MVQNKFLTEKERARDKRNAAIRADYSELRKSYPDVTDNRIFAQLAEKHKLTKMMIYWICTGKR